MQPENPQYSGETPPRLPSLFLIGAPRCATSTLSAVLAAHPAIFMSTPKEPRFFAHMHARPAYRGPGDAERVNATTLYNEADYRACFRAAGADQLCADASSTYLGDPGALRAIAARVEAPRLVAILRDPVERPFSACTFKRRQGLESKSAFIDALQAEAARIAEGWSPMCTTRNAGATASKCRRPSKPSVATPCTCSSTSL